MKPVFSDHDLGTRRPLPGHRSSPVPSSFAGVGADIRSDLYSLGVALWEMVTGHVLFRGSPAEVMYQHQHATVTT